MIKILVSTAEGQEPFGDFNWTNDGEIVTFGEVACDSSATCGCDRAFIGVDTRKGTTTAVVREVDMPMDEYVNALHESAFKAGWRTTTRDEHEHDAGLLIDAVAAFEPGVIVRMGHGARIVTYRRSER